MGKGGRGGGRFSTWSEVLRGESSGNGNDKEVNVPDPIDDDEFVNDFSSLEPNQIEEILYLHPSDHPGMQLVSTQLTGINFLNWSRSVKRALGARSKLELIDGTLPEPEPHISYYKQWLKADYMISAWIVNSISKDLVNSFTHIDTAKKLWDALNQRFGRCNGPKIYKLQREISGYCQGNLSVVQYFTDLTALWDELDMLLPPLECTCLAKKQAIKRENQQRLIKFLHGLNPAYEQARSQILLLEPLPHVDKAYAMIIQVEDELSLHNGGQESSNMMVMNVADSQYSSTHALAAGPR